MSRDTNIAHTPVQAAIQAARAGLAGRPGLVEPITGGRVVGTDAMAMSTGTIRDIHAVVHLTAEQQDTLARAPQAPAGVPVVAVVVAYGKALAIGVFASAADARLWWNQRYNRLRTTASVVHWPAPPAEANPAPPPARVPRAVPSPLPPRPPAPPPPAAGPGQAALFDLTDWGLR